MVNHHQTTICSYKQTYIRANEQPGWPFSLLNGHKWAIGWGGKHQPVVPPKKNGFAEYPKFMRKWFSIWWLRICFFFNWVGGKNPSRDRNAPTWKGMIFCNSTLPKTNIAPENRSSQKETSSSNHQLAGGKIAVSFREGKSNLGGFFKYFLFSPLLGEDFQFD